MQSLTAGTFTEDFNYGYPYSVQVPLRAPEFDYAGQVVTSQGLVVCPRASFALNFGAGIDNADAGLPYGGPPTGNPYYLSFPVLDWNQAAGLFLTVTTTAAATVTFDRAFSGYVGDRFTVMVGTAERLSITGSAGYSWTRNTLTLPKGTTTIAFVLKTATYTGTGVVREGVAQSSSLVTTLHRYLRISNVTVTHVASLPQPLNASAVLQATSSLTGVGQTKVTSGRITMAAGASLICPQVTMERVVFTADATINGENCYVGKFGQAEWVSTSSFSCPFTLGAHHFSDTGGFAVSTQASLVVEATVPPPVAVTIRPLRKTSVVMSRPTIIHGAPVTTLASCETEVVTTVRTVHSVHRIDPYSPANRLPVAATFRWLSIDATYDQDTRQLNEWHATDYQGPIWSTPGDYRPTVSNYSIKASGQVRQVKYPSVQFDAAHLDHLVTQLPASSVDPYGAMTWVFIGSLVRYRGQTHDNSPIIDFASDTVIDYAPASEYTAERGNYMPWLDSETASSIYLGLTAYSDKDVTSSALAYRTEDATRGFAKTSSLVVGDNTPVILIYRLNGQYSSLNVTPLTTGYGGTSGSTNIGFARGPVDPTRTRFCLGKSRITPPYNGSFLTGSMSLLEVGFYNRTITDDEVRRLQAFYSALYSPVAGPNEPDYTTGKVDVTAEQVLFYAADPETPLVLLSGSHCVPLGIYPSTVTGRTEIARFTAQGVPVVQVSNRDYAALIAQMESA